MFKYFPIIYLQKSPEIVSYFTKGSYFGVFCLLMCFWDGFGFVNYCFCFVFVFGVFMYCFQFLFFLKSFAWLVGQLVGWCLVFFVYFGVF